MTQYENVSLWFDTLAQAPQPRASLNQNISVDVAIIGAGYTGLWSAYYLKKLKPELNIVILEAQIAGYGASGRNGGWVTGSISGLSRYLNTYTLEERRRICRLLFDNVDEIGQCLVRENIDAHFRKGGVIDAAARFTEQLKTQQAALAHYYQLGYSEQDCYWLNADQLDAKLRLRNGYGAIYQPHCATVNPAKLVRGLADTVEKMGVKIYENTSVVSFASGAVNTQSFHVKAATVIPALEGYTPTVKGSEPVIIPVQSLIIATEPLSDQLWAQIGLRNGEAFCDASRMVSYGQRSADGRMVLGSRGGYQYGSKPVSEFSLSQTQFRLREKLLYDLFPMLQGVKISHGWGGSLGIARPFAPHVVYDEKSGLATAGGYGGQGVAASHLFARTLVDLILKRETPFIHMPWVYSNVTYNKALRKWEPEPCRWLASQVISKAYAWEEQLYLDKKGKSVSKSFAYHLSSALSSLMR